MRQELRTGPQRLPSQERRGKQTGPIMWHLVISSRAFACRPPNMCAMRDLHACMRSPPSSHLVCFTHLCIQIDGKPLAQSSAIERDAAKLAGLIPEDP